MEFYSSSNKKSLINVILIGVIILILAFIVFSRFSDIEADPDVSISKLQGAYVTDEGWKSGNSINKYLSNTWLCNDKNDILLWPVMPLLEYMSFRIFGLSLFALRLPSVILSTLLIILLGIFLYISQTGITLSYRLLTIILYLFLASTNYFLYIQGRIAFFDIPMSAIGLAGLLILYKAISEVSLKKKYLYFIFHGILIGVCICVKTTGFIFMLASIFSILLMKIINRSNQKANIIGESVSLLVTVLFTLFILFLINYKITGTILTIPFKYMFNPEAVHSSQIQPILIIKNYMRFFTNNVIIYNHALFLLMCMTTGIVLCKSIQKRALEVSDSIMFSLTMSSFLFLGFFTPQAERYFTVLIIPMLYFIPKLLLLATNLCNEKGGDLLKRRFKSTLVIIIILLVFSNIWNVWKIADYSINKKYTLKNTALLIKKNIEDDMKIIDKVSLYMMIGMPTSTLAVINKIPFTYHVYDHVFKSYYYITNESSELETDNYTLISHYKIFNFENPACNLYLLRLKSKAQDNVRG